MDELGDGVSDSRCRSFDCGSVGVLVCGGGVLVDVGGSGVVVWIQGVGVLILGVVEF